MAAVQSFLPRQIDVHRRMVEIGGLRAFSEIAFPQIEPREFKGNWHIDAVCDHLQAVTSGDIRNLVINIPPGCMKSLLVSVLWPAWVWLQDPAHKWIFASYSSNLSRRDALRCRNLVQSPWFQERWGFETVPGSSKPDYTRPLRGINSVCVPWQNTRAAMFYENNHRGFRFSTSVGGEVTGRHADSLVIDDPNKSQAASGGRAATGKELQASIDFWSETMSTRQADPKKTRKVIIMQRLHTRDLAGAMIDTGEYEHLMLPMEYDPSRTKVTSIGFRDPRTQKGEPLWEGRFGVDEIRALRTAMGPTTSAAQLDQSPNPVGGSIFRAEWLNKVWTALPLNAIWGMSVDCAFKAESDSDFVVIQVWCKHQNNFYLIDQKRERLDFPSTITAIEGMKAKWPKVSKILIEDKANGSGVISILKRKIPGIKPIEPEGGKESRASGVSAYYECGDVLLPPANLAPWIVDYRSELVSFPRGANDDQVDASSQILLEWAGHSGDRIRQAMEGLKKK